MLPGTKILLSMRTFFVYGTSTVEFPFPFFINLDTEETSYHVQNMTCYDFLGKYRSNIISRTEHTYMYHRDSSKDTFEDEIWILYPRLGQRVGKLTRHRRSSSSKWLDKYVPWFSSVFRFSLLSKKGGSKVMVSNHWK